MKLSKNGRYAMWALSQSFYGDISCPSCGTDNVLLIKRKAIVTKLYKCNDCSLMYRYPKSKLADTVSFYQNEYEEGFTTACPSTEELTHLTQNLFKGTEKDYSVYINVLAAAGVLPGHSLLDFGASWGYGSWQFSRAGYKTYSYEISKPRARYAEEKLGCQIFDSIEFLPEKVDCFFSSHVIEHLPVPNILWEAAAQALKPNGKIVLFMPNGDPVRKEIVGENDYHSIWGEVHPLLISSDYLSNSARRFGFSGQSYSSPFNLANISSSTTNGLTGDELLFIATRQH